MIDDLEPGPVALDAVVFIYFIEEHPRFLSPVKPLFRAADAGQREIVTSAMTLSEVLVVPYRAGNDPLAHRYEAFLSQSRGIRIADVTREQLRSAARLRAAWSIKTPDALQLAAALTQGCTTFVTNDRRLPTISGLRILQLGAYATDS